MVDAVLPDAEWVVTDFLENQAAVTAITGTRIGTSLSKTAGAAIRVVRVGGPLTHRWEDEPTVQIECWSADSDRASASDLARTVLSVLPDIVGSRATPAAWVSGYTVTQGPLPVPDDSTRRQRFLIDVVLHLHPN